MFEVARMFMLAAVFLLRTLSVLAQAVVDPSGHWEGSIKVPDMEFNVEIDLAKNAQGALAGTFSEPAKGVKGLPLSTVAVEGRSVRLVLRTGDAETTFAAVVAEDGKTMTGMAEQSGFSAPFVLTRKGEARITATPKSAAIRKELEGTWNGSLDVGDKTMRLVLTMANQADGTAAGTIVSPDGSGIEIPVAITVKDSGVTIDVPSVGASFAGVVNAGASEMAGTWKQGPSVLPLTFKRATQ